MREPSRQEPGAESQPISQAAAAMTVREATFSLLRAFGMTTIFGNPGSTELPLFRHFPTDFRYVLGLQESIVVGMADGFAQATRNAAFVNLHSAVGVGHAMGNLFTAFRNQTPLVIVAGQQARSILPFEPFLFSTQATELPKPYVKWSCEPARAEDVPLALARAYYLAMQSPRGPTFVSVPVDDWDRLCAPVEPRQVSTAVRADPALLEEATRQLNTAMRPVFVVGGAVARDGAWDEVIALAERYRAPVWVSPLSPRNSFPEDHPLFAGFLPADRASIVSLLSGHDLILALGAPVFTYHVEGFGPHVPPGARLIQLIDDPSVASWTPVGMSVVSSLRLGLQDLLAAQPATAPVPRASTPAPPERRLAESAAGSLSDPAPVAGRVTPAARPKPTPVPGSPLTDRYLLQQIAAIRSRDSIIVEEAPSSREPMHDYLPILQRDTFYTCASGGLGHGLPAAVGVALGRPGQKVIALLGDGSCLYAIQGLWTAVQWRLPITFVIVNNRRYEALVKFGRHFGLDRAIGTDLSGIDFSAIAQGQGCQAHRIDRAELLDDALRRAFASAQPVLLDVIVQ